MLRTGHYFLPPRFSKGNGDLPGADEAAWQARQRNPEAWPYTRQLGSHYPPVMQLSWASERGFDTEGSGPPAFLRPQCLPGPDGPDAQSSTP